MHEYLNERCYYRITDEENFEDLRKIITSRENIVKIERIGYTFVCKDISTKNIKTIISNKKIHNNKIILRIYFRSTFTGRLKIISIEPCNSSWDFSLRYAKIKLLQLVGDDLEEIDGNDYDQKLFKRIENILKDYRTSVERKFDCTVDVASYYNWKSKYKFYKNDNFIVLSDRKYIYKFLEGKIDEIYSCNDNKILNKHEYPDTHNVKCMYENYIDYLATDEFIRYENDLYVNKDKLINKAVYSNKWHSRNVIELSAILVMFTGLSFILLNSIDEDISLVKLLVQCIFFGIAFFGIYYKLCEPFTSIDKLERISEKYIPADTKAYVKANKTFGDKKKKYKKQGMDTNYINESVQDDKVDEESPDSAELLGVDFKNATIKSVTKDELVDHKIEKINKLLKEGELLSRESILINKVLPDINDLVDNYSFLNDKTKDNLLIALDDLEHKLSSSYEQNYIMEFESISSVVKKQISEL